MEWFENWFDTEFYHILYAHRDDSEAHFFIDNLFQHFNIEKNKKILDLACGKGRHSLYMSKKGNDVWGMDLSKNSIEFAEKEKKILNLNNVHFSVGDMRSFKINISFDYIFNLFTSFGYFDDISDNDKVISSTSQHQSSGDKLIIDFLNSEKVRHNGDEKYTKSLHGIRFDIEKNILNHHVVKKIKVTDLDGKIYNYMESVQLFKNEEIATILDKNGYKLLTICGEYDLSKYHADSSRSIFIAEKI